MAHTPTVLRCAGLLEIPEMSSCGLGQLKLYDRVPVFTAASQHTVQLELER